MKHWWRRIPIPTKIFFVVAVVAFVVDLTLGLLAGSGVIATGIPLAISSGLFVLSLVLIVVLSQITRRREMDEIVRRVREEDRDESVE